MIPGLKDLQTIFLKELINISRARKSYAKDMDSKVEEFSQSQKIAIVCR